MTTREEKILEAMQSNIVTGYEDTDRGMLKAAAAISQLFDQEMIEFSEWVVKGNVHLYEGNWFSDKRQTTAELLQLFKNR